MANDPYFGMRDELNAALSQLDRVTHFYARGTDVREHVDLARSQVLSALIAVSKAEQKMLREIIAENESDPEDPA